MKIAMLGLKGLPGIHGGVEKHVEELGARLAAKGHRITVYCRKHYTPEPKDHRGMTLRLAPTIHSKHLDATIHTILGGIQCGVGDYDLVHYHAIGPGALAFISRALGRPVITTVHSLDYLRDKWGRAAKWALRQGEKSALFFANRVITVSRQLKERYDGGGTPVAYIPNGVSEPVMCKPDLINEKFGLTGDDYILWAGRFSPEKGPHYLVQAIKGMKRKVKVVLAGGVNHTESYVTELLDMIKGDDRFILPGFVSGRMLHELFSNTSAFVLSSEHEGMPIALLEAMSYSVPCVASDIPQCREVAGEGELALLFETKNPDSLREKLRLLLDDSAYHFEMADKAKKHVLTNYSWDSVAGKVEAEYEKLLGAGR